MHLSVNLNFMKPNVREKKSLLRLINGTRVIFLHIKTSSHYDYIPVQPPTIPSEKSIKTETE